MIGKIGNAPDIEQHGAEHPGPIRIDPVALEVESPRPRSCWQNFELWWYEDDMEKAHQQMHNYGLVKTSVAIRLWRMLSFLILGYFTLKHLIGSPVTYFIYLTAWGEFLTALVFGLGCISVPTG